MKRILSNQKVFNQIGPDSKINLWDFFELKGFLESISFRMNQNSPDSNKNKNLISEHTVYVYVQYVCVHVLVHYVLECCVPNFRESWPDSPKTLCTELPKILGSRNHKTLCTELSLPGNRRTPRYK